MHAGQDVGPRVGGALANQEVPVLLQQFLCIAAAHHAMVPRLALQLLLRPEGQRTHQEGAGVVHRCHLVKPGGLGLGLSLGQRMGLRLDGVLKGLWQNMGQNHGTRREGDSVDQCAVQLLTTSSAQELIFYCLYFRTFPFFSAKPLQIHRWQHWTR